MSDYFEKIVAGAPVNATTARQMGGGEHWEPAVTLQDCYADCPPLAPIDAGTLRNPEWVDFTGREFGRLMVIGLMAKESDKYASWVCRCKCGSYCTRKSKSLKVAERGGNSFVDRCGRCHYLDRLRRGWTPDLPDRKLTAARF